MMVFKRKQIVVLSLVLMIVVAGYLQYTYKKSSSSATADKDNTKVGEAVYVGNNSAVSGKASNSVQASKQANDFFKSAMLDKEMTRSKDTDALKEITLDANATTTAKSKAYDQMMKIISNSEKEMSIENLIKGRGYSDVLVLFGEDQSMDIYIKTQSLTQQQVAQISDIASRQANVDITKITVKNIF
jgi:stage III sporulation protein AH